MTDTPESVNLSDVSSRKVDTELLNELRDLFARAGDQKERYDFTWNGKAKAYFEAATPTTKTLRPQPEESYIYADDDYKEKVNTFNDSENLFITGDNLEALKLLQESYLGKIDMIYIDPPYNTGNNVIYKNDFSQSQLKAMIEQGEIGETGNRLVKNDKANGRFHSDWLSMMFPRLRLARNLMTDSGIIVVAMDDSELSNTEKLLSEVFGERNKLGLATIVHKPEGRNQEKFFGTSAEYALFYAKDKDKASFNKPKSDLQRVPFIRKNRGDAGVDTSLRKNRPNSWYPLYVSHDSLEVCGVRRSSDDYEVFPIVNGIEKTWESSRENLPNKMKYLVAEVKNNHVSIYQNKVVEGVVKSHWDKKEYNATNYGTNVVKDLMGANIFSYPKSVYLMEDIIELTSNDDDTVLDFFAGSGTTAHAVMKLNNKTGSHRKHISVILDEPTYDVVEDVKVPKKDNTARSAFENGYYTIDQISRERIRRAAKKLGDTSGFRALKVDKTGLKEDVFKTAGELTQENLQLDVDNQANARSDYDLLYDVLVDGALEYNCQIATETISNESIIKYDYLGELSGVIAYFGDNLTNELTREIAKLKPLIAVFKESTFNKSSDKVNVLEQFRVISPETKVKVI